MYATTYGQVNISEEERKLLHLHQETLASIFHRVKLPNIGIKGGAGYWIEWRSENAGTNTEMCCKMMQAIQAVLDSPLPFVCPTCGPGALIVLDIDIIKSYVFNWDPLAARWRPANTVEHSADPNLMVRCSKCQIEMDTGSIDPHTLLTEAKEVI
jgi:hypothetical protein